MNNTFSNLMIGDKWIIVKCNYFI